MTKISLNNSNDYDALDSFEKFTKEKRTKMGSKTKEVRQLEEALMDAEDTAETLSERVLALSQLCRDMLRHTPVAWREGFSGRLNEALSIGDEDFEVHP